MLLPPLFFRYPHYVLHHLHGLQKLKEEKQVTQAVCLLYVSFFMRLYILKPKELSKSKLEI